MAKGQSAFGHGQLAQQLAIRLRHHFSDDKADASLVIGIFGEWGSGKSNLLQLVHDQFGELPQSEEKKEGEKKAPPVIVVPFNPWRYEKEEHLLVPLLKTMQRELLGYAEEHQSRLKDLGWSKESPKRIARFFGVSALAFAKALKVSGEIPGVGSAEFSFSDFIEKGAEAFKDKPIPPELLDTLESYYFEFEQKLRDITSGASGEKPIHLLFLIDDLDRCLPEKAVEMLESIKLFLDVEGCAFVLAVDDEVVERGIVHRYRDYLFQGKQADGGNVVLSQMPITGTEYLEKIVQLPFRLPMPLPTEIRTFLLKGKYVPLFSSAATDEAGKSREVIGGRRTGSADHEIVLDLFVTHIPPVPRKQIRAAELVSLLLELANARGCRDQIKLLPLVKLTMLQLFAPEIYRFGRRRSPGFMSLLEEWSADAAWGEANFASGVLEKKYSNAKRALHRQYLPLMALVEETHGNRSGFDLFAFIKAYPLGGEDLRPYFSLMVEGDASLPLMAADDGPQYKEGSVGDEIEFLELLFSESPGAWQSAVQRPELAGCVLPASTFDKVVARLSEKETLQPLEWYLALTPVLTSEQKQRLPKFGEMRQQALDRVEKYEGSVIARARAGQLLSELGDPRAGVTVKRSKAGQPLKRKRGSKVHCLPDIAWEKIPSGTFRMGTVGNEGDSAEMPAHDVSVTKFFMSRYLVTNAQYRCFIEAGMYEDEAFWRDKLPATAAAWWAGEDDGRLLTGIADESLRERYREWLKEDIERRKPRFWHDRKWSADNHPVVGVSWYEALAYSVWLNELAGEIRPAGLPEGMQVRLPSEAEWEYAARGPGQNPLRYAWGYDHERAGELCNGYDAKLQRTSAVGLFPAGATGFNLYDMTGNVWEWLASRWGGGGMLLILLTRNGGARKGIVMIRPPWSSVLFAAVPGTTTLRGCAVRFATGTFPTTVTTSSAFAWFWVREFSHGFLIPESEAIRVMKVKISGGHQRSGGDRPVERLQDELSCEPCVLAVASRFRHDPSSPDICENSGHDNNDNRRCLTENSKSPRPA